MRLPSIHLSDLSPFGPIFGKELRITSRRKRNHLLRVVYLGGMLLFLLMVYTESWYNRGNMGVAARVQQQNRLGQEFFLTFSLFCSIAMGLITPVLTSTAISSERLGKTLPVLLMTPITSWQIVCGKLFSRLLIALMLIGLSLPVLAVVRLLGGVELDQMLIIIVICTLFALSSAAVGLFFSTLMNRAFAVILLSYAALLLMYLFVPMVIMFLWFGRSGPTMRVFSFLNATNPLFTVMLYASPDRPVMMPVTWWSCALGQIGLTTALVTASAFLLRWFARREGERAVATPPALPPEAMLADAQMPQDAAAAAVLPVATPVPPPTSLRHVGDNPVLWREMRRPLMTRRWSWIAGALVVALLLLSYWSMASIHALDDSDTQIGYALVLYGLYWLLIAVLSATAIAQEKESDTWTVLLASPLSARQIVLGKLLGLSRRMLWPTLLIVFHFAIFGLARVVSWPIYLVILWVLISFNTVWAALGTYLSLRLKKVTTAVIVNLIMPVVCFIAVPVILVVLGQVLANNDNWASLVGWYLPYYYLVVGIDRLCPRFEWYQEFWSPSNVRWMAIDYVRAVIIAGSMHILAAMGIVTYTIRNFDRYVGRAQQR